MSARISDRSDQSSRPAVSNTQGLEKKKVKIRYRVPEAHCISLPVPTNTDVGADIKSVGAFFYQDQIYIFDISMKRLFFLYHIRKVLNADFYGYGPCTYSSGAGRVESRVPRIHRYVTC
jgi:hypothetical protein